MAGGMATVPRRPTASTGNSSRHSDDLEERMPRYLLSIYQPDGPPPPPDVLGPVMERVGALNAELKASGAWVFTGGLHPPDTATVVRVKGDELLVTDGPFIEGKEHVGGFYVIEAADLDAALAWARKLTEALSIEVGGSRVGLPIEVRPFQHGGSGA
jgi:hypothetical protein